LEQLNSSNLGSLIDQIACSFRVGYEAQGNELLKEFTHAIDSTLSTLSTDHLNYVNACLTLILNAQSRRDIIFIADIIEYEIKPIIS